MLSPVFPYCPYFPLRCRADIWPITAGYTRSGVVPVKSRSFAFVYLFKHIIPWTYYSKSRFLIQVFSDANAFF